MAFWLRYSGACLGGVIGFYAVAILIALFSSPGLFSLVILTVAYQICMVVGGGLLGFDLVAWYFYGAATSGFVWIGIIGLIMTFALINVAMVVLLSVQQSGLVSDRIANNFPLITLLSGVFLFVAGGFMFRSWVRKQ